MKNGEILASNENMDLIYPESPIGKELIQLGQSYLKFQHRRLTQERRKALGKILSNIFLGKEDKESICDGWPEKNGRWNFALMDYLWGLMCESNWWLKDEPLIIKYIGRTAGGRFYLKDDRGYRIEVKDNQRKVEYGSWTEFSLSKTSELTKNNAGKFRKLYIEAIFLHYCIDYSRAPTERKPLVIKQLIQGLPEDLASLGIIFDAMPDIPIYDTRKPGIIFEPGNVYRLFFEDLQKSSNGIVAYCLGFINNEPFFELDTQVLPTITPYQLGQKCWIQTRDSNEYIQCFFIGLTISGKPVFAANGRLYTERDIKQLKDSVIKI